MGQLRCLDHCDWTIIDLLFNVGRLKELFLHCQAVPLSMKLAILLISSTLLHAMLSTGTDICFLKAGVIPMDPFIWSQNALNP